ncbi:hypothetical protein ACF0H5_023039 [Mactra antiquata]
MAEERRNSDQNSVLRTARLKKVRRLCELFHGRFSEEESEQVLARKEYDIFAAASFIIGATTQELQNFFRYNHRNVETVRGISDVFNNASSNNVPSEWRQFVCATKKCKQKSWWGRRVPERKPVSRCNNCSIRYDALSRDQEFGVGLFQCICGHKFKAFAMMDVGILIHELVYEHCGKSENYCYKCGVVCNPIRIIPPKERNESDNFRRTHRRMPINTHACTARNCYNRRQLLYGETPIKVCVHPSSKPTKDPEFCSTVHISTGSTVETFLTQHDHSSSGGGGFEPDLGDIAEVSDTD